MSLLVFLTIGILFFALLRFREKPPGIAANSVLVLRLRGDLPELAPVEIPIFSEGPSPDGIQCLDEPAHGRCRRAHQGGRAGAGRLERAAGPSWKNCAAISSNSANRASPYLPTCARPRAREYYIATAADRIYLGPEDPLYLKGMRAEIMYFKKTLDKLGVSVEVEHAGKYKDFGDMFTRPDMSPETREVITSVVDDLYGNLIAHIAAGRKKTPEQVRALIDEGPFLAPEARESRAWWTNCALKTRCGASSNRGSTPAI